MSAPTEIEGSLRISWRTHGRVSLDLKGKIEFPEMPVRPGLYRFTITPADGGAAAVYVGETDNLRRRFAHYRNPGPSQMTNLRLNALFRTHLNTGAKIEVSAVTDDAWINLDRSEKRADLGSKYVRRLFEGFVLAAGRAEEVEILNR